MTKNNYTTSVIIPGARVSKSFLNKTKKSIEELESPVEIIISVDGKQFFDLYRGFEDTVLEHASEDKKIKFIYNSVRSGPSIARNLGVEASTGDIVTHANMGDEIHPQKSTYVREVFNVTPEIGILVMSYDKQHPSAGRQSFNLKKFFERLPVGTRNGHNVFRGNMTVPALCVAHLRAPFKIIGGFQHGLYSGEEEITWRRMAQLINPTATFFSDFPAGCTNYPTFPNKDFPHIKKEKNMEGFRAGQYLDQDWFTYFNSDRLLTG